MNETGCSVSELPLRNLAAEFPRLAAGRKIRIARSAQAADLLKMGIAVEPICAGDRSAGRIVGVIAYPQVAVGHHMKKNRYTHLSLRKECLHVVAACVGRCL